MRLEDIVVGARLRGVTPSGEVTIKTVEWFGDQGIQVIYKDAAGNVGERLLYRDDEYSIELVEATRPWSFTGDGQLLRLVSEAYRIHRAWLFDPYLAISTSTIEPLPHQISAVYEEMLPRQPMRFLLADDPGAGKTIMAGLLIKELIVRGDLERCLIVSPGSLTEQWQDELVDKFGITFEILNRGMIEAARTANPFEEKNLLLARLDQVSRNEDLQERLKAAPEWDLVVVDEAHRMSAHYFSGEVKKTKRYGLGEVLGAHTRNFLLMTATPHSGKEEDFQLFLALLDGDRFEGRALRDGVHTTEPSDLMRRLVKEDLLYFDGRPLFPERRSYTAQYPLTEGETELYAAVTEYVRLEMNRAEKLAAEKSGERRRNNVGFALQILQRRLASSPESIYRSLERRREKLESKLREARLWVKGSRQFAALIEQEAPSIDQDEWDEMEEEAPQDERDELEGLLLDHATAAQTLGELEAEIARLKELEKTAKAVRNSGHDAKWNQLVEILDRPEMVDGDGTHRKLIVFTEFRDTLRYVASRIRTRIGRDEAVVEIHGGVGRDDRRKAVNAFMNDPEVLILVANDAAGEGVNLQRAHLMVNYDLPWNPNRLEQRFGRIHRIGQTEVCHLWNLIAKDTREGDVYIRLLSKLEAEREALGGKVFDVLGSLFEERPLRDLLMEAIRYGDDPKIKARIHQVVDNASDRKHIQELMERRALVQDQMDTRKIQAIREDMERAHARRLQPHYIQTFFVEAFKRLGGKLHRRENGRFEITHVPQAIKARDRLIGRGAPVLTRYERICFEKDLVNQTPRAELVCPGHPLLDCTIDLVIEQYRDMLKQGAVLIDESDPGKETRLLFYLEHSVQDGRQLRSGKYQTISKRFEFVETDQSSGQYRRAGSAPYLDYRPPDSAEWESIEELLDADWLKRDWEQEVLRFAIESIVPDHVSEVRERRLPFIDKVEQQVRSRLQKEVNYWDHRAQDLKAKEEAGKNTRLPAHVAQERADRLADRLKTRLEQLDRERKITAEAPVVVGGALIIPGGLLYSLVEHTESQRPDDVDRKAVELAAMEAVMTAERALGREPQDVSATRGIGYDIESREPDEGRLYFIEVKGRHAEADTVTLTRNEILCALNTPDRFRLAIVLVDGDGARDPVYVQDYDFGHPGFEQTSGTYPLEGLLRSGKKPS